MNNIPWPSFSYLLAGHGCKFLHGKVDHNFSRKFLKPKKNFNNQNRCHN